MTHELTFEEVHRIRTESRPDSHWARELGMSKTCVQKARVGATWRKHPTPPDTSVRLGNHHGFNQYAEKPRLMSEQERLLSRALASWPRVEWA